MALDKTWTPEELEALAAEFEHQDPQVALKWALQTFAPGEIVLACSFGAEDVALVDMINRIKPGSHAFYLDTDVLFKETYDTRDAIAARYDVKLLEYKPLLTLDEQAAQHGEALWASQPDACCGIRKVEPLQRALAGRKAWITGIRRDQAPTRANTKLVEWDAKWNLVKLNPLAKWTWEEVWMYIRINEVPYNVLHDQNYPSIGCIHCTRPVNPGEDPRAGRWSGTGKVECGLHPSGSKIAQQHS